MSLDLTLKRYELTEAFDMNLTHNLTPMASAAGLYDCMWRPEENGVHYAKDLVEPLQKGLDSLLADPDKFIKLNPANGWGSYDTFVAAVRRLLDAAKHFPDAEVHACV